MSRATLCGLPAPQYLTSKRKAKLIAFAKRAIHAALAPEGLDHLTGNHVLVFDALLFRFHRNGASACFPSHATLARYLGLSISCVKEALKRLEALGMVSWVHRRRLTQVDEEIAPGAIWRRWRALRTSNAYRFGLPVRAIRRALAPKASKAGNQPGPRNPVIPSSPMKGQQTENEFLTLSNALDALAQRVKSRVVKPPD